MQRSAKSARPLKSNVIIEMNKSFEEIKNSIEQKAHETNTGAFDSLLLQGGSVQLIHSVMEKKGYRRVGWFFSERSFWGHIGVRIRDNGFMICINNECILKLDLTKEDLEEIYNSNVHIKLVGVDGDFSEEKCTRENTLEKINWEFYQEVSKSIHDNNKIRKERLQVANKIPDKIKSEVVLYKRNNDVIAEVLLRAKGKCELCKNEAPFQRATDNTPYLEVHHKIFLSEGGEDTVENAIALCPNCHRQEHFGARRIIK